MVTDPANPHTFQLLAPNGASIRTNQVAVLLRGTEPPLTARTLKAAHATYSHHPTSLSKITIHSFIMSDTPISNDLFQYRNTSGVYASCYDRFSTNAESLCQFDYPEDFATTIEPWNYPPDTFTTHFTLPGDQSTEIKVMLFGEVLSEIEGTALGAMGGSSLKRDQVSDATLCCCRVQVLTQCVGQDQAKWLEGTRQNRFGSPNLCQRRTLCTLLRSDHNSQPDP
jgi:hypothetical protein